MKAVARKDGLQLKVLLQSTDKQSLNYTITYPGPTPPSGHTPLLVAVFNSSPPSIVDQLLNAGASVNFKNDHGSTPLFVAATRGKTSLCKKFLSAGAHFDSKIGFEALCRAASCGHIETIRYLLEQGAVLLDPLKALDDFCALQESPMGECIKRRDLHVLEQFMVHSDTVNLQLPLPFLFHWSIQKNSQSCAIFCLQQGYYPTPEESKVYKFENSCFHKAAYWCHISVMELLIEINPYFLQEEWVIKQEFPGEWFLPIEHYDDFLSWLFEIRKNPPSLTWLCKSVILAQLEPYYIRHGKIEELPLPRALKAFLKNLEYEFTLKIW